jgi:7-keto-8-aminopelargonate synthetase-like enzyme
MQLGIGTWLGGSGGSPLGRKTNCRVLSQTAMSMAHSTEMKMCVVVATWEDIEVLSTNSCLGVMG